MKIVVSILSLLVSIPVYGASLPITFDVVAPTTGDPTVSVLPSFNDAFANWKNAGLAVVGGIPNITTQCATISPTGITPPASGDDADKIQAAINACPSGEVVSLGAGTFNLDVNTENIFLDKSIVLRGTGLCTNAASPYCSTVIQYVNGPLPTYNSTPQCGVSTAKESACPNASAGMINVGPASGPFGYGWSGFAAAATQDNPTTEKIGTTLAADVAQGATTVQLTSTTNFKVGGWALIDEAPELVTTTNPAKGQASIPASAEFLQTTGSPVVMRMANPDSGNCTYGFCTNRINAEIHQITAVGAGPCPGVNCTVTFDDPLTMPYRISDSHDARMYWPTQHSVNTAMPFLTNAGVENITLLKVNGGGIDLEFCAYCWVRNVEVGNWIAGAVNTTYAVRSQITHNYFHNCIDCQNNGNEYPLGISTASTEILADDNIILLGGKGMVGRAANTAVIANNYQDDTFYETTAGQIGDYWLDMGVNGSHYAASHHFLFEGNWGTNCDDDETHGSSLYHTYFRNWCTGYRTPFTDPSINRGVNDLEGIGWTVVGSTITSNAPAPLRAAGPMAFNYWDAFVGNVLGTPSTTTSAGWKYLCTSQSSKCIWMSGWTGSEWNNVPDSNLNGITATWLFKHGNYDYVNGAIADFQPGFSQTLPNSFYLNSPPPTFGASGTKCSYSWPWVTPTATKQVQIPSGTGCSATDGLPAKARWDAGTPFVQP
jgi:hypothetical protein